MIELSMVIGAIVEMGVEAVWDKATRRETVIRVLEKVGLKPDRLPSDFDSVYAYTLVEYGVGKPKPILDFFRHELIRNAFRQSFERQDASILEGEAESLIEWHKIGDDLRRMDVDPRREFAGFTAVFNEIVGRTRTPAEVKRDKKLDDIYGDLHQKTGEIIEGLDRLDILEEIRAEIARLAQSHQARQFVVMPTGEKLKVFISSKMAELRDVREFVAKALDHRGIDAWVYEAHAGARPEDVVETSLSEVEAADIYVGLFWHKFGNVTVQEYRHARALGKPCFVYIRDKHIQREKALDDFLQDEVCDLHKGVTYDYFDSAVSLGNQVADDVIAWLVRRHREMTAEIQEARVSRSEIARLQAEVDRLQAISREPLPEGTPADYLAQQVRAWFETLGYDFEPHDVRAEDYFEWIIDVPGRRGYDRILVRGIEGETEIGDIDALRQAVDEQGADEGWLVAFRRVSQAARGEVEKKDNRDLFCYTFDELLDEDADFGGYLDWLEDEVKRRGIDMMYVPLACTKEEFDLVTQEKVGESRYDERNGWIDGYVDRWLDDPSKEHISVLGEFGTGKTWFALHYAWIALQRYRKAKERGIERPRLPIVIPLRDYAKAVSVESLFSEFFFRKHEIPLPGYSAFEQLNRMAKLLLIFDGFDEMAAKVDRQKMINNFWELARVVVPGSKAILTCRTEHFPEAKEGRALLSAELKASTAKLTGEPPQFEVLELDKFDDDQIRQVLSFRADPAIVEQVMSNPELLDLARRPIMTEFILEALPDIEAGKPVDLSRVYLYAVLRKMERDIKAERTFTSLADKLYFLCELSWEMLSTDQISLNYRHFPGPIRRLFGLAVEREKDLDHWHYDMMGQTMLIRNADGDYTPAHRSLLDFFVAYKFAAELGVLAPDFTGLARAQSNLDESAPPQDYAWSAYFQRQVDAAGSAQPIHPLANFICEPVEQLATTFGAQPLSREVAVLMGKMIGNTQQLWRVIEDTKNRSFDEVAYLGGNALTLLHQSGESFAGKNLAHAVLDGTSLEGADFAEADLQGVLMRGAMLSLCTFQGANLGSADLNNSSFESTNFAGSTLQGANLRKAELDLCAFEAANLSNADLSESTLRSANLARSILRGANLRNANLNMAILLGADMRTVSLQGASLAPSNQTMCAVFAPDDQFIANGGNFGGIQVWSITDKRIDEAPRILKTPMGYIHSLNYSPYGRHIACGCSGGEVLVFNCDSGKVRFELRAGARFVPKVRFRPDGAELAAVDGDKVIVWNMADGSKCREWASPGVHGPVRAYEGARAIAYHPDGSIAVGLEEEVIIWETLGVEQVLTLETSGSPQDLRFSPCGRLLAAYVSTTPVSARGGPPEDVIELWDIKSRSIRWEIRKPTRHRWIAEMSINPSGSMLCFAWENQIHIVDLISGQVIRSFRGHHYAVNSVCYSSDGTRLVSSSVDNTLSIWDAETGHLLSSVVGTRDCEGLRLSGVHGIEETTKRWLRARGAVD